MKRFPSAVAAVVVATGLACSVADAARKLPPHTDPKTGATLPLQLVGDVPLPGGATRFDYQDIDAKHGHLALAHMNDSTLVVLKLADGSTVAQVPGIDTVRGIAVAPEVDLIFASAINGEVVRIDAKTLTVVGRTPTGAGPDGVAWDPIDHVLAASAQRDGALTLVADAGTGRRKDVPLGVETGNVVFDPTRKLFWITVVTPAPPNQLVGVDPTSGEVKTKIGLPGCAGAHGLRLHPDGNSAIIACEDNDLAARVNLSGNANLVTAAVGAGPDVLSVDPGLQWIYVAAESGDLTVFDLAQPGLVAIDREHVGDNAHSVAVDPATHRVFFPLMRGPGGKPVMRIMRPGGL